MSERQPRIGILVVAYNAAATLAHVLDRIPRDFAPRISEVLVFDDHSDDATYLVGLGYQQSNAHLPLRVFRNDRNLGYGGNQKAGYRWAIEHDLDIIVLLHGDGQYAPEMLPEMVAPLERGEADAVFGSRMLTKGAARRGGMPVYKYVGNKILTRVQNAIGGADLSEWHSGYRAYSVAALRKIPFERNVDVFDFDCQIIIQLLETQQRIVEIPIPTYYGDEISYVNGLGYARDVVRDVVVYRAHKMGFGSGATAFASREYELKEEAATSHRSIVAALSVGPPRRVLDLGCSAGHLAAELRKLGHEVVGVDVEEHAEVAECVDRFVRADLDDGIPEAVGDGFDIVLAADVLEHVPHPEHMLRDARRVLAPGGRMLVCVPNIGHWYPRARVAAGRFAYERRGILDAGHVRFFTRRSFGQLAREQGFEITRRWAVGVPIEVTARAAGGRVTGRTTPTARRSGPNAVLRAAGRVDAALARAWPTLFGYQLLFELTPRRDTARPAPTETAVAPHTDAGTPSPTRS